MKNYWRCAKVPVRRLLFPIGARGPNLVAVEQPADDHFGGIGADRGEIGGRVLRRHPDVKIALPRVMADTTRRFISAVPDIRINGPVCRSTNQWAKTGAPAANITSKIT